MAKKQKTIQRKRLQSIGNTYMEGAQINGQRSQAFLSYPLTAEKEFSYYNRRTLLKKKRYLESGLSIIGGLIGKVKKYVVGRGVIPMPCTADDAWNDQTTSDFIEWASNPIVCDAMGMQDFWDMQGWMAGSVFSEAEGFAAMVNSAQVNAPQLQLIDPGEVEYFASSGLPPALIPDGEFSYFDGVKLNSSNRIVAYAVRVTDGGGPGGSVDVDVSNMIHCCTRLRPNQYRGVTPFCSVVNSGVDVMDLKGLGVATAKLHAAIALAYTKAQGPGVGANGLTGELRNLLSTDISENGAQVPTGQNAIGENVFAGAMINHLGPGEKLELLTSQNPSINLLNFMEWFYREIAIGAEMSVEIVWNLSLLGGAPARINLDDLQAFFDLRRGKLDSQFNNRVYKWWLSKKFQDGYPYPNDPAWWKCHWLGPRKITADAGNTAKSFIDLMDAGCGTWAEWWASMGTSWKGQVGQRFKEVAWALELANTTKPTWFPGTGLDFYNLVLPPKAGAAAKVAAEAAAGVPVNDLAGGGL